MKASLFPLLLAGAALTVTPPQMARADDGTTPGPAASSSSTTNSVGAAQANGTRTQRLERFKEAFAQLGLTDAQKDQIKQIRASVTDRKERREQIVNVLTADQKAKLHELIRQHRDGSPAGADTLSAPGEN